MVESAERWRIAASRSASPAPADHAYLHYGYPSRVSSSPSRRQGPPTGQVHNVNTVREQARRPGVVNRNGKLVIPTQGPRERALRAHIRSQCGARGASAAGTSCGMGSVHFRDPAEIAARSSPGHRRGGNVREETKRSRPGAAHLVRPPEREAGPELWCSAPRRATLPAALGLYLWCRTARDLYGDVLGRYRARPPRPGLTGVCAGVELLRPQPQEPEIISEIDGMVRWRSRQGMSGRRVSDTARCEYA